MLNKSVEYLFHIYIYIYIYIYILLKFSSRKVKTLYTKYVKQINLQSLVGFVPLPKIFTYTAIKHTIINIYIYI